MANDYDSFAEAYTAAAEANLVNGHYERPAILDMAGDVAGRRILDAGCGSGPLFAALRDRGATVTRSRSSCNPVPAPTTSRLANIPSSGPSAATAPR